VPPPLMETQGQEAQSIVNLAIAQLVRLGKTNSC
jgi:hypothetical protein